MWCWRRLLRVPWTARRTNQSILKEISTKYSLEGLKLVLKRKLQYFGHLMRRTDSMEKTLMLGKIEGTRKMGQQRMRWSDGITDLMDMSLNRLQEFVMDRKPGMLLSMGSQKVKHDLSYWTEVNWCVSVTLNQCTTLVVLGRLWMCVVGWYMGYICTCHSILLWT